MSVSPRAEASKAAFTVTIGPNLMSNFPVHLMEQQMHHKLRMGRRETEEEGPGKVGVGGMGAPGPACRELLNLGIILVTG